MQDELNPGADHRDLQSENDFLKMKLMLEHGAVFGGTGHNPRIPPDVENAFLRNIEAFEQQWANVKYITIYEKIGRPDQFKPVAEIPDHAISDSWEELSAYMLTYGLVLEVCSPNISARERYRFVTEELFQRETEDLHLPGFCHHFIYDEFYPDPLYENERMVTYDLFHDLFDKMELQYEVHYRRNNFYFNGTHFSAFETFKRLINNFKAAFESIALAHCNVETCTVSGHRGEVKGNYEAIGILGSEVHTFGGNFEVKLEKGELGYWYFTDISIHGFSPK